MKKLLSLFALTCCSLLLSAQVGYLLPYTPDINYSGVGNVYDFLPYESAGHGEESPERKAYEWFNETYTNATGKQIVTVKDVKDGVLLSGGVPTMKVLWINVDKVGLSIEDFDAIYNNSDFINAVRDYVKAGGNVFLTKQATRIVSAIGRCSWWPDFKNDGYIDEANDQWDLTDNFCGNYNRHGHAIFANMENYFDDWHFPMTAGNGQHSRTNNNNTWGDWDTYAYETGGCDLIDGKNARIKKFEDAQNCQILGGWGHTQGMDCAGFIEFFPNGDYKGTVVAMGLAAYQWGTTNAAVYNVKNLTTGVLNYLSITPDLAWNEETVPASGVINTQHIMTAHANAGFNITYAATDPVIANIGSGDGNIYFNYFGDATFTATATGDGWTAPKSATATITSATIPVNGGDQNVKFAYVLPYSMHVMANYDNEEGRRPDFEAANWFYWQFIVGEVGGQHGCFVRPSDLGSLNPAIKVLWIHNDHVGKESADYYNDLGGDTFRDNLAAFINNGGNVFVSKQATRLVGDLGYSIGYPRYANGGYADDRGPWRVANKWNLSGTEIDHSTHSVYANMGTDTWLMSAGRRTDNNNIWHQDDNVFNPDYGSNKANRITQFEADHNCRVLGAWGHYDGNNVVSPLIECVGFVELYPSAVGKGTVIAMGLAAYQWAQPVDLLKNFTRDILYYLHIDETPGFAWIQEPADGLAGTEQIAQVEHKDSELQWTSSNTDVVEIVDDPEHPGDKNFKKLLLKAVGTATITATRSADGYRIPKNVTSTTNVTKTITVTNAYTREGLTVGNYYTVCLPKAAESYTGAVMFSLAERVTGGVVIEEATTMEAGVPYIFQATAATLNVTYADGDFQPATTANGLVGYIGDAPMTLTANPDYYVLKNNKIWLVDADVTVPSNRAYINVSGINPVAPAPGRIRRVIPAQETPTALETLDAAIDAQKFIRNGQLYIRQAERTFNAQGQLVQ